MPRSLATGQELTWSPHPSPPCGRGRTCPGGESRSRECSALCPPPRQYHGGALLAVFLIYAAFRFGLFAAGWERFHTIAFSVSTVVQYICYSVSHHHNFLFIYTLNGFHKIKLSNLLLPRKSGTINSLQLLSTLETLLALEQLGESTHASLPTFLTFPRT